MIHVIATIELAEGRRGDFLREFSQLVPQVRAEQGCLQYGPTIDVDSGIAAQGPARENIVTVVEQWENLETLEAHLAAAHMKAYRETVAEMVRGMSLQILRPA